MQKVHEGMEVAQEIAQEIRKPHISGDMSKTASAYTLHWLVNSTLFLPQVLYHSYVHFNIVSYPDPTLCEGKGLSVFLVLAESAVLKLRLPIRLQNLTARAEVS